MSHNTEKEYQEIIEMLLRDNGILIRIIDRLIRPPHPADNKPLLTLSTHIQNQIFIMADLTLVLNTPKTGLFTLTDRKSGVVLTTAVFSKQAVGANSNPEFATFALDPANASQLIATPIAAGTGSVVISADATYTDLGNNTQKSDSFTATKNFTVTLSEDGVTFDVVFP